jgi:LytS/YehU family sensor histidine kinase
MNLTQLPDLQRMREDCGNPRLKRYYDEAIRQTLAGAADERLPQQFMRVLMWVLLVFFSLTGAIGILAAIEVVRVNDAGLSLIWKTFVTSVVGLVGGMLRSSLGRKAPIDP